MNLFKLLSAYKANFLSVCCTIPKCVSTKLNNKCIGNTTTTTTIIIIKWQKQIGMLWETFMTQG